MQLRPLAVASLLVGCISSLPDRVDLCHYGKELCDLESYSGFLPVKRGGSLFYWYFVPPNASGAAPLILWLQGGPGQSSMAGNFFEMGPVTLDHRARLQKRDPAETWASEFPVLFVDSPVGAGWSFAGEDGYATSSGQVVGDLLSFLEAFQALHPEAPRHLVVAGESYAGHFVPALAASLLRDPMKKKKKKLELQAVVIGNSFLDPPTQVLTMPSQAYAFGMLDEQELEKATKMAQRAGDSAEKGALVTSARWRHSMENFVSSVSHRNLMDVRTNKTYGFMAVRMQRFFSLNTSKRALHIPRELTFGTDDEVPSALVRDVMRSQKHHVERLLLAGTRVLLYQGQFDWKEAVSSNEAWIASLQWPGAGGYKGAQRTVWRRALDGQIAGSWHRYENLEEVVVLGAGHMAPMDQPRSALDMLQRFLWQRQPGVEASLPALDAAPGRPVLV